jgi:hypothetical protein
VISKREMSRLGPQAGPIRSDQDLRSPTVSLIQQQARAAALDVIERDVHAVRSESIRYPS